MRREIIVHQAEGGSVMAWRVGGCASLAPLIAPRKTKHEKPKIVVTDGHQADSTYAHKVSKYSVPKKMNNPAS